MKAFLNAAAAALLLTAGSVAADTIVLDFEGIDQVYPANNDTLVQEFYNGGASSNGSSGTNFGVSFSDNAVAICLNTPGTDCSNTSRGGEGNPNSQLGGLIFFSGNETFMNVAAGFDTGFSFFYAAANQSGSVSVFDDLNGQGDLLATLNLAVTPGTCASEFDAEFCPFAPVGVSFAGTAKSVSLAGVADQIVIDDVTFGSEIPDPTQPVPLPAGAVLLVTGLAALGVARRRA